MSDGPDYRLNRRNLLVAMSTVGAAGALTGRGAAAYLTDREILADNSMTAGSVTLALDGPAVAERDAVVHEDVVADFGGRPDDDADAVVDNDTPTDFGGGVDFDARHEAGELREEARARLVALFPEEVGNSVGPQGVKTGITGQEDE